MQMNQVALQLTMAVLVVQMAQPGIYNPYMQSQVGFCMTLVLVDISLALLKEMSRLATHCFL